MSQSMLGTAAPRGHESQTDEPRVVSSEDDIEAILTAFNDDDCRRILEAVSEGDERLSAAELSDRCDVPLSTTYRKLELLTEASLLDEHLRICPSGRHTNEYDQGAADVRISVEEDSGIALQLS